MASPPHKRTIKDVKATAKSTWTDESDDAYDKANNIAENSPADIALDKKRGVSEDDY